MEESKESKRKNLGEVAALFLRLGFTAFGGPAVHISMMEEEVVRKKKWMSRQHFLDLVGATNLIPGPNSTEMTMHCGQERAGRAGLIVAGSCFILPAVLITSLFAWFYSAYGRLPEVNAFIYGIKPAIIAVVITAVIPLGKKSLKSYWLGIIGLATLAAVIAGVSEIIALFGAGLAGMLVHVAGKQKKHLSSLFPFFLLQAPVVAADRSAQHLFWIFLKIGSILYGSGYVLFAFLDEELVGRGLLTRPELIDAIAVGQFTPGPVFSSATFVGWQVAGLPGAIAATVGIFLPSFLFVAFLNPLIPRLRKSGVMSAFLDAVNVASVAMILWVAFLMARESITDWRTIVIAITSIAVVLFFKKLNSAFIVLGGSVAGYLLLLV